jgi:hypothetical protein
MNLDEAVIAWTPRTEKWASDPFCGTLRIDLIAGSNYSGAEDVVAARRPPDSRYLFIDKCYVEGAPCP